MTRLFILIARLRKHIGPLIGWVLIIIGLVWLLSSCSPVKRLQRLQRNNPYLFENLKDTITVRDTVRVTIPAKEIDTSVSYKALIDTVTITKDGITTKVWLKPQTDTVYVKTKADPIRIKVPFEKKVIVTKYQPLTTPHNYKKWLWPLLLIGTGITILYLRFKKRNSERNY